MLKVQNKKLIPSLAKPITDETAEDTLANAFLPASKNNTKPPIITCIANAIPTVLSFIALRLVDAANAIASSTNMPTTLIKVVIQMFPVTILEEYV